MATQQLSLPFESGLRLERESSPEREVRLYEWLASRPAPGQILTRAVSLRQPWLRLITLGLKTWEFRTRPHGRPDWTIALHASKKVDPDWRAILRRYHAPGETMGPTAAICAVATLGRCVPLGPLSQDPERHGVPEGHPGRPPAEWSGFAWELLDMHPIDPPLECGGQLGVWVLRPEQTEELLRRVRV
jgi:hypothetical protein